MLLLCVPVPRRFVVVQHGLEERRTPGNTLAVQPDKPYQGLSQFGTGALLLLLLLLLAYVLHDGSCTHAPECPAGVCNQTLLAFQLQASTLQLLWIYPSCRIAVVLHVHYCALGVHSAQRRCSAASRSRVKFSAVAQDQTLPHCTIGVLHYSN
jgi:hypothetical protein